MGTTTTTTTTTEPVDRSPIRPAPASGPTTASGRPPTVLAGLGGLTFVGTVVVQNVIRGAVAPKNDADATTLIDYFNGHRGLEWALVVLFTVGAFALATFAAGLWSATAKGAASRTWAQLGVLGTGGIVALFSAMVACEVALGAAAQQSAVAATSVPVLWTLHNAVFSVLTLMIGIALFGWSRAATTSGVAPAWIGPVGVVGACLLALNTALAPLVTETSSPAMAVGALGFLGWVVFVVVASLRLLRLGSPAGR